MNRTQDRCTEPNRSCLRKAIPAFRQMKGIRRMHIGALIRIRIMNQGDLGMDKKWITILLGMALILAPSVTGYIDNPTAFWTSVILGSVVAVLGYLKKHGAAAVVGIIILMAPWVLGFHTDASALWSCLVVGGTVGPWSEYRAIAEHRATKASVIQSATQHLS